MNVWRIIDLDNENNCPCRESHRLTAKCLHLNFRPDRISLPIELSVRILLMLYQPASIRNALACKSAPRIKWIEDWSSNKALDQVALHKDAVVIVVDLSYLHYSSSISG